MLVPPEVMKCVVFLGYEKDGRFLWRGSGFVISEPVGDAHVVAYLVTAQHVVNKCCSKSDNDRVVVRFNCRDGTVKTLFAPKSAWRMHPTKECDVAVCQLRKPPGGEGDLDFKAVPISMFATPAKLSEKGIGPGDDVIVTGLFTAHHGTQRNLPIVRVGCISAMPDEPMYVELDQGVRAKTPAFLAETRSIGGLSGSPVFAAIGPMRLGNPGSGVAFTGMSYYLLGVMYGHWSKDAAPEAESSVEFDEDVRSKLHTGIAIVTPAEYILGVLDHPDFNRAREQVMESLERSQTGTPDFDSDPTNDPAPLNPPNQRPQQEL